MPKQCDNTKEELSILIMSDFYYTNKDFNRLELVKRVKESIRYRKIDLIVLLGNISNYGNYDKCDTYLLQIKNELDVFNIPYIIVPSSQNQEETTKMYNIKGYRITPLTNSHHNCQFNGNISKIKYILNIKNTDTPIVVFESESFYFFDNTKRIDYKKYKEPFKYSIVTIKGFEYEIQEFDLKILEKYQIADMHIHTHYAYCSSNDMLPKESIKRQDIFGIKKIGLVEHAAQLYIPEKDYWSAQFIEEPDIIERYKDSQFNRMKVFKQEIKKYKSVTVKIGLEVELNANGNFALLEEDYEGWDFIIGAVHYLPQKYNNNKKEGFMWANQRLIELGIDILAHPFRYFIRNNEPIPKDLYKPLVELLANSNTAVELNFHTNNPDPIFFKECIEQGVKIALGSDSHDLYEVGCSQVYLDFLMNLCDEENINSIIYT